MKSILSLFLCVVAITGYAFSAMAHGSEEHQHTKSVGPGAKTGTLSKAERKALREERKEVREERKQMRQEMMADGEMSPEEKKKLRSMKKNKRAEKVATPVAPTKEQIEKADAEDEEEANLPE